MQASSLGALDSDQQLTPKAKKDFGLAFIRVVKFFLLCAEKAQVMVAQREVAFIIRAFVKLGTTITSNHLSLIRPLRRAVDLTSPSNVCLTPSHAHLLQLCITGQMYGYAVEFIKSKELLEIQPRTNGLVTLDYLKYFYYSGICFIAVKDWSAALESLLMAITTPTNGGVSAVVGCALKKAKLVQLIQTGKSLDLPKHTATAVTRHSTSTGMQLYESIVKLYEEDDLQGLQTCINGEKALSILNNDSNHGLAEQVIDSLLKLRIKQLTKTYCSLSLADIASRVALTGESSMPVEGSANMMVEKLITSMTFKGDINASIDQCAGIVRFESVARRSEGCSSDQKQFMDIMTLQRSIAETVEISDLLRQRQNEVLTSTHYVMKTSSGSNTSGYLRDYQMSGGVHSIHH